MTFAVLVLASAAVFFWPAPDPPQPFTRADLAVHATVFAVLMASGRWAFGRASGLLGGLVAYACLIEVVQGLLLPGRMGEVVDILADLVGALVVWLPWRALRRGPSAR